MKRITLIFVAFLALALPGWAVAQEGGPRGEQGGPAGDVKRCMALRAGVGAGQGIGKCMSERAREHGKAQRQRAAAKRRAARARRAAKRAARRAGVRDCREERGEDVVAFQATYGEQATSAETDDDGDAGEDAGTEDGDEYGEGDQGNQEHAYRHAFRNCVRQKVKATILSFKNAAQECRAERADDVVAFRAKYGTNRNKRNAFGKCVSGHVREDQGSEQGGEQGGSESDEPDGGPDSGPDAED